MKNPIHLKLKSLSLALLSFALLTPNSTSSMEKVLNAIPESVKKSWLYRNKGPIVGTIVGLGALAGIAYYRYASARTEPALYTDHTPYANFWDWKKACDSCARYPEKTPLSRQLLEQEISLFKESQNKIFSNSRNWVGNEISQDAPFCLQKLDVNPGTKIAFHGDVHGDIKSINAFIAFLADQGYMDKKNPFQITDPNFKIFFLGDYTDRGKHGAEVIFTIMRMKRLNPNQFFMVRGNHEDRNINDRYGLTDELKLKFGKEDSKPLLDAIASIYPNLPVASLLISGTKEQKNAILCCHGGPEFGFCNMQKLLDEPKSHCFIPFTDILAKTRAEQITPEMNQCLGLIALMDKKLEKTDIDIGYMWNDFIFDLGTPANAPVLPSFLGRGAGWTLPEGFTKMLLHHDSTQKTKIRGVFRAHQHTDQTMPRIVNQDEMSEPADAGVAKLWLKPDQIQPAGTLWDGIVCTFCVSPNTGYDRYASYTFDSFGILTTAPHFEDWKLEMHRIETKFES